LPNAEVAAAVEKRLNDPAMTLQFDDAVSEALELFRREPALGFADCLILAPAMSVGQMPLGTFDRRLGKLEGAEALR